MGTTVDDVLVATKRVLQDPERVVRNPDSVFEGGDTFFAPERGCFMGAFILAARDLRLTRAYCIESGMSFEARTAVSEHLDPEMHIIGEEMQTDGFTETLRRQGTSGCIAAIDRTLEARRVSQIS